MAKILLLIFLSLYFTSAQLASDSGLAFEVVAAEAQDAKANVTENDQEAVNATTHSHHTHDEAVKEHGRNEPKLLKVRATVEEQEQKHQNETAKDDATERHPKELKLQKDTKQETTTTAEPETTRAP
ncbi:hypothetical protein ACH3XW_7695 [Acanthocheilonema viteae]|uniref:Uncharacterized protein n=1 Tax=Acanthocheilonema viteae TaxID=6277 RepID=A0A498SVV4_ACAVI|nr:unnamed protein product [Acanthocheilonema viteae]